MEFTKKKKKKLTLVRNKLNGLLRATKKIETKPIQLLVKYFCESSSPLSQKKWQSHFGAVF